MSRVALVTAYWTNYVLAFSASRAERAKADDWAWAPAEVDAAVEEPSTDIVDLLVLWPLRPPTTRHLPTSVLDQSRTSFNSMGCRSWKR